MFGGGVDDVAELAGGELEVVHAAGMEMQAAAVRPNAACFRRNAAGSRREPAISAPRSSFWLAHRKLSISHIPKKPRSPGHEQPLAAQFLPVVAGVGEHVVEIFGKKAGREQKDLAFVGFDILAAGGQGVGRGACIKAAEPLGRAADGFRHAPPRPPAKLMQAPCRCTIAARPLRAAAGDRSRPARRRCPRPGRTTPQAAQRESPRPARDRNSRRRTRRDRRTWSICAASVR